MNQKDGIKMGLIGAVIGAAGASLAWLLSDPEKREKIKVGANGVKDKAIDKILSMKKDASKKGLEVKKDLKDIKNKTKDSAKKMIDKI